MSDNKDYATLSDAELVEISHAGDDMALEFLLEKYKNLVRVKARPYFLVGADKEDIVQEGMIGLYKAVLSYRDDKQRNFKAFADMCITRQIISAIKTATRLKHQPLNSYISLNKPVFDEETEKTLLDTIAPDRTQDPEELYILHEDSVTIETRLAGILSELELRVLRLYLSGATYQEIAQKLGRPAKTVDNAIQRVKNKLGNKQAGSAPQIDAFDDPDRRR